jgi:hypothetical protein
MLFEAFQPELNDDTAGTDVRGYNHPGQSYNSANIEGRSAQLSRQLYDYWQQTFAPIERDLLTRATDPNAIEESAKLAREINDKSFDRAESNADFALHTYGASLTPEQQEARKRYMETQKSNGAIHAAAKAVDDTTNRQEKLRAGVIGLGRDIATSATDSINQLDAAANQRSIRNEQNQAAATQQRNSSIAQLATTALLLSTEKAKKNIKPVDTAKSMDVIRSIDNKGWEYKEGMGPEGRFVGGIAEELPPEVSNGKVVDLINQAGHQTGAIQNIDQRLQALEARA